MAGEGREGRRRLMEVMISEAAEPAMEKENLEDDDAMTEIYRYLLSRYLVFSILPKMTPCV